MTLRHISAAELGVADELTDDELLAAVQAAIPRYLAGRLRARLPWLLAGLVLFALFTVGDDGALDAATAADQQPRSTTTATAPPASTARPAPTRLALPTETRTASGAAARTSPTTRTPPPAPGPTPPPDGADGGDDGDDGDGCTTDAAVGPTSEALEQVRALVPGAPADPVPGVVATAAGCEEDDPAFALLGALLGLEAGPVPPGGDVIAELGPVVAPACAEINETVVGAILGLEAGPPEHREAVIEGSLALLEACNLAAPPDGSSDGGR